MGLLSGWALDLHHVRPASDDLEGLAAMPLTRRQDGIRSHTAGDGVHELPLSLNAGGIPGIATGRDDRHGQGMDEKPAKVLTIEELSTYLRIQRPTLYQLD